MNRYTKTYIAHFQKEANLLTAGGKLLVKGLGNVAKSFSSTNRAGRTLPALSEEFSTISSNGVGNTARQMFKLLAEDSKAIMGKPKGSSERNFLAQTLKDLKSSKYIQPNNPGAVKNWKGQDVGPISKLKIAPEPSILTNHVTPVQGSSPFDYKTLSDDFLRGI